MIASPSPFKSWRSAEIHFAWTQGVWQQRDQDPGWSFFQEKETEDKEVTKAQLEAEWAKFKFDLDAWKSLIPPSTFAAIC